MSSCKKVKNPCKICLGPVSRKTGLQCQGACECWVHFSCLNYTPGKIKDIKAGIINITCPCPDCTSTLPKEYRSDEPFSCDNLQCPANMPPLCQNTACPINKDNGPNKMNQTSIVNAPPLDRCGAQCKKHSLPGTPGSLRSPGPEECTPHPGATPAQGQRPHSPINSKCPSLCSSLTHVPGDYDQPSTDGLPSMRALEQMCNTVGQLTNQINCLMHKMKQVVEDRNRGGGCGGGNGRHCPQKGPRSMCPKPCYCPENPVRRK